MSVVRCPWSLFDVVVCMLFVVLFVVAVCCDCLLRACCECVVCCSLFVVGCAVLFVV